MNFLIDARGSPPVLDLWMARMLLGDEEQNASETTLTRTGRLLGTLPWSSPEQINGSGDAVDGRRDVYALGVMLFALLAGQFPYPVVGDIQSVTHHISKTAPGPPHPARPRERDASCRAAFIL